MKPSGPGVFFMGVFFITDSIFKIDIQLTLAQHRFELCGSTYTQIFNSKYCNTTWSTVG